MPADALKLTDAQERNLLDDELARSPRHGSGTNAADLVRSTLRSAATAARVIESLRASARAAKVDFSEGLRRLAASLSA